NTPATTLPVQVNPSSNQNQTKQSAPQAAPASGSSLLTWSPPPHLFPSLLPPITQLHLHPVTDPPIHGGGAQVHRAAAGAPGGPGRAHASRPAPPLLAGPVPHADGADRVAPRLQGGPRPAGRRQRQPGRDHRARPRPRIGPLLPSGGPPGPVGVRRAAGRGLQQRRRVVHGGPGRVHARGRGLPGGPADGAQGRPPPAHPGRRGRARAGPARPGHRLRVRRLRRGLPLQPRRRRRPGRRAVHDRGRGAGPRQRRRRRRRRGVGGAAVGPRRDPGPGGGAGGAAPDPRRRHQAAGVPRHGHLRRLHRALQGGVQRGARGGRRVVLRVRGAHRQGVAEPHPRGGVRAGHPRPRLLRRERAARAARLAPARRRRVLRQLLLHHARVGARGEGGGLLGGGGGEDRQGRQAADARGVRAVGDGRGRRRRRRPVPDHGRLPHAAGVRLDAPRLRGGGLRLGPARARRAAHQPGLHRHVHPGEAVGAQARGEAHHAVRHPGPRRRLPRRHARHQLLS
uniref:Uncharacterized protein n=1 Tax=Zea mays TaxID=4577 RepID=A0A804QK74_MAIZE